MRKSLNEKEIRTIIAVFGELQRKPYNELNTFLGSITIEEMCTLQGKLNDWYHGKVLGDRFDEEFGWVSADMDY